eukprot:TRINITY_DN23019_c0_g1_i1.p2 TRINITY_DN23019_c0_g1~~TRINITY_DN23019_c0_g1_i1.p2  ORF type:complete len:366 (+),score=112.89 TRINITY_DN23019_c0_g1_i1:82-1179(+)
MGVGPDAESMPGEETFRPTQAPAARMPLWAAGLYAFLCVNTLLVSALIWEIHSTRQEAVHVSSVLKANQKPIEDAIWLVGKVASAAKASTRLVSGNVFEMVTDFACSDWAAVSTWMDKVLKDVTDKFMPPADANMDQITFYQAVIAEYASFFGSINKLVKQAAAAGPPAACTARPQTAPDGSNTGTGGLLLQTLEYASAFILNQTDVPTLQALGEVCVDYTAAAAGLDYSGEYRCPVEQGPGGAPAGKAPQFCWQADNAGDCAKARDGRCVWCDYPDSSWVGQQCSYRSCRLSPESGNPGTCLFHGLKATCTDPPSQCWADYASDLCESDPPCTNCTCKWDINWKVQRQDTFKWITQYCQRAADL